MPNYTEIIKEYDLPFIPLPDTVWFPSVDVAVESATLAECAPLFASAETSEYVVIALKKQPFSEGFSKKDIFTTGCIIRIGDTHKNPNTQTLDILINVMCRAEIKRIYENDGIYYAHVVSRSISYNENASSHMEALKTIAIKLFEENIRTPEAMATAKLLTTDHTLNFEQFTDHICCHGIRNILKRQELLEIIDPIKRMERAIYFMSEQSGIDKHTAAIENQVASQMKLLNREHFLREEIKLIHQELGDESIDGEDDSIKERIASANLPKEVSQKLLKEASKLERVQPYSPEYSCALEYIETCLALPWQRSENPEINVDAARKILERDHYGLDKVKKRILEFLAVKKLSPELGPQIICLVGPPGTGKTSIAASVAKALGRKYVRVSLGGLHDEAELRGHRKTYVASMPGRIIRAVSDAGSSNPVILLDEIDKISSNGHGDPAAAMLEILDPEQNKSFRDNYIELPFDLSDCVFIATANTLETVARPLIDRMEIIELSSYTDLEKIHIAKKHLIPKQLKISGLSASKLKISESAVSEIINYYTAEAGVRNLEREIASLCRKAALKLVDNEANSISITSKNICDYLGARKATPVKIPEKDLVGEVNGLAYTSVGGDLLKVEVSVLDGNGKLELTGSLGDVIKESAQTAVSYIRSRTKDLGIDPDFYKNSDIHIHFPDTSTPKDGPSAGVTIVTALASALTGKRVYRDIAMTGEVSLRGNVTAIGGLREKTLAAYKAGVKRVIIPKENVKDLDDIDKTVREKLEFFPVDDAEEVLNLALRNDRVRV